MSSVKIPCPACAAALTLDDSTAGTRVVCSDCRAEVKMPVLVDAALLPTLLHDGVSEAPSAARLPTRRDREKEREISQHDDDDWETRGSISDARPVGAPLRDAPEGIDAGRPRTKLPERRSMEPTPATGAHAAAEHTQAGSDWADEQEGSMPPREMSRPARDIRPIPVKPDQVMQPGPLAARAPSRRPSPAIAQPESRAAAPPPPTPSAEQEAEGAAGPKGGHRLGEDRQLHFTPFLTGTGDVETTEWSADVKSASSASGKRLVIFAAAFVLLLGAAYGVYVAKYGDMAAPSAGTETETEKSRKNQPNPLENLEAARVVLRRFFAASNVEDMLKEVRHPEITGPRLIRFLDGKPLRPRTIENEGQAWNEIRLGETEFITGVLSMDDFRIANVALEILKDGSVKVDWESYANWAEVSWADFLKNQPDRPVDHRVTVMPIRYYNYAFQGKEAEMLAFRLEDPEKFGYCYAYCHKDSPAAARLIEQLRKARRLGRVTKEGVPVVNCILRLHFPEEGKKGNQALIDDYVSESWIQP